MDPHNRRLRRQFAPDGLFPLKTTFWGKRTDLGHGSPYLKNQPMNYNTEYNYYQYGGNKSYMPSFGSGPPPNTFQEIPAQDYAYYLNNNVFRG